MAVDPETGKFTGISVPLSDRAVVHQSLRAVIVFCVLIAIWSGLRLYARRIRRAPLNTEDMLFFSSVAAFYAMVGAYFVLVFLGGVGHHMSQLNKNNIARLTQSMLVIQGLYGAAMCASKWSILWMLKRVFAVRSFAIFTWVIIVLQGLWVIMTVLIGFLVCRPLQKNWDPTVEGKCGDQHAAFTAVSIVNIIVDVAMCLLPIPMIYRLQVKKPYKLALFGIFGIGILSVIFAVVRLFSLRKVDFQDFSYSVPEAVTWTYSEVGVVILVACSPLLRPIFDQAFRRLLSGTRSNLRYGQSDGSRGLQNSASMPASTGPKMNSKARNDFITLGESEESLELGNIRSDGQVEIQATTGRPSITADQRPWSMNRDFTKGIMVKQEVSQTVNMVK